MFRLSIIVVLISLLTLSGCALKPIKEWDFTWLDFRSSQSASNDTLDEISLVDFVNQGALDEKRTFAQTPWGEQLTITLGQSYYSASGKQCRELTTQSPSQSAEVKRVCMR